MSPRIVGVERQGGAKLGDGVGAAAGNVKQDDAQIIVRLRVIGRDAQRGFELGDGIGQAARACCARLARW